MPLTSVSIIGTVKLASMVIARPDVTSMTGKSAVSVVAQPGDTAPKNIAAIAASIPKQENAFTINSPPPHPAVELDIIGVKL
jgi:hypothetical protein